MSSKYAKKIKELKNKSNFSIYVKKYGSKEIKLRVISNKDLNNKKLISSLTRWRGRESFWFAQQFNVTYMRTRKWLEDLVIKNPDRILFAVEDDKGKLYGHLGFYRYRARDNSCELDNVVRGLQEISGLMTDCVNALVKWGFENLGVDVLYLTTFDDNLRAISLYKRCHFKKINKIPLKKIRKNNELQWVKIPNRQREKAKRFYARMVFKNPLI